MVEAGFPVHPLWLVERCSNYPESYFLSFWERKQVPIDVEIFQLRQMG